MTLAERMTPCRNQEVESLLQSWYMFISIMLVHVHIKVQLGQLTNVKACPSVLAA